MSAEHLLSPPGSVELHAHETTFHHFMLVIRWVIVINVAGLPFLVVWFTTGGGFLAATVTGVILFAIGVKLLIQGPGPLAPPPDAALY